MVEKLNIVTPRGVRSQVTEHLRRLIVSGDLKPGQKLPSTKQLAEEWGAHVTTIQAGMEPLVKEGLLSRSPKTGTFVRERRHQLLSLGLYLCHNMRWRDVGAFTSHLAGRIIVAAKSKGARCRTVMQPRWDEGPFELTDELRRLADSREIQGLAVPNLDKAVYEQLEKLGLPFSCLSDGNRRNAVVMNFRGAIDQAVAAMAARGRRHPAMITNRRRCNRDNLGTSQVGTADHFAAQLLTAGIQADEKMALVTDDYMPWGSVEESGYRCAGALLGRGPLPDALLVTDDVVARGVVMKLLERKVQVPRDLELYMLKNDEIDYLCPYPATAFEFKVGEIAAGLVALVEAELKGEPIGPIVAHTSPRELKAMSDSMTTK